MAQNESKVRVTFGMDGKKNYTPREHKLRCTGDGKLRAGIHSNLAVNCKVADCAHNFAYTKEEAEAIWEKEKLAGDPDYVCEDGSGWAQQGRAIIPCESNHPHEE
jgi:hypothetical protein